MHLKNASYGIVFFSGCDMKVFVTGGSGFIGKRLVDALIACGHEVSLLSRNPEKFIGTSGVNVILGDLTGELNIDLGNYDVVFHCAGEINDVKRMQSLHIAGTKNLLSKGLGTKTRWVQLSSVGVYGKPKNPVVTEDAPFLPSGVYEETKAASEVMVREYCLEHQIPFTILRPTIVFGVGMTNQSIIQLIRLVRKGLFGYFSEPSKVILNYIHVDDVVHALIECASSPKAVGESYIVNDPISLEEFVHIIRKNAFFLRLPRGLILCMVKVLEHVKIRTPLTAARIEALTCKTVYSMRKIEKDLEFRCVKGVKRGLEEMIAFY